MIKTILVPIDVAAVEAGIAALEMAQTLAGTKDCRFVLLSVIAPVPGYLTHMPADIPALLRSDVIDQLNRIINEHAIADTSEAEVRHGNPAVKILEFADEVDADLIVIGSHDPGLVDYFHVSVAARVVRHAHCSVLVARKLHLYGDRPAVPLPPAEVAVGAAQV